ncbi:hypothetical protein ACFYXP_38085 [Streptomyces sp. NPDC002466]|uniref:hypothetical protein n=1 Tax=Streptomyces sp. NPDC002466 TaxID=3364646 RepID=UPI0036CCBC16
MDDNQYPLATIVDRIREYPDHADCSTPRSSPPSRTTRPGRPAHHRDNESLLGM